MCENKYFYPYSIRQKNRKVNRRNEKNMGRKKKIFVRFFKRLENAAFRARFLPFFRKGY